MSTKNSLLNDLLSRLSPKEFRQHVVQKGWSYADLSEKWGISAARVSQIANDSDRPPWFDDAVKGLPRLLRPQHAALKALRLEKRQRATASRPVRILPGYRYQGEYVFGSIFIATKAIGELAEEGDSGRLVSIKDSGVMESYNIDFNGMSGWFTPDEMDEFLAYTGIDSE